jgi:hypothetical protein
MALNDEGFIFTMDASLALIAVFVITATVSQITSTHSSTAQSHILPTERVAQDVLEVIVSRLDYEELNTTKLYDTLEALVPSRYNYSYVVEYKGNVTFNVSRGSLENARDVMVAKRLLMIKIYSLLGIVAEVSHGGSPETAEECEQKGARPPIYLSTFQVETGDLEMFDFWIEGRAEDGGVNARYYISNQTYTCQQLQGATVNWQLFMQAADTSVKVQLPEYPTCPSKGGCVREGTNYLYLRIEANPNRSGDFYVIKSPEDTDSALISLENARKRDFAWAILKVSEY